MRMLLSEQFESSREYIRDISFISDCITGKSKKVWALMSNFPAVLWIPFFLMVTMLIGFLGR